MWWYCGSTDTIIPVNISCAHKRLKGLLSISHHRSSIYKRHARFCNMILMYTIHCSIIILSWTAPLTVFFILVNLFLSWSHIWEVNNGGLNERGLLSWNAPFFISNCSLSLVTHISSFVCFREHFRIWLIFWYNNKYFLIYSNLYWILNLRIII